MSIVKESGAFFVHSPIAGQIKLASVSYLLPSLLLLRD